jgi:hypothetical protein
MAKGKYRTIRLTGLGKTLNDKIKDLEEIRGLLTKSKHTKEIEELVNALQKSKKTCREVCDGWSRRYKIE